MVPDSQLCASALTPLTAHKEALAGARTFRPPRRQGSAVAQVSRPAVSQTSRSAGGTALAVSEQGVTVLIHPGKTSFRDRKGKLRKYTTHLLVYHDAAGRHRERRGSLAKAKARAAQIARDILNGQAAMARFSEADRATYLAALAHCAKAGIQLLDLAASWSAAVDRLRSAAVPGRSDPRFRSADFSPQDLPSLSQLADFYLANRPRDITPLSLPALVTEFLSQTKPAVSTGWYSHLEYCLERFTDHFAPDPKAAPQLHLVDSAALNSWLRSLKGKGGSPLGHRTRHNYRAAVDQLARWAQANGHLPKDWAEMQHVADPGAKPGETKILTPDQLLRLISTRHHAEASGRAKRGLVPFIALQAWAGIRHEEMNGEKALLDWRHIDLENRVIYVPKAVAKTGNDRLVPICDTLAAWLADYAKTSGPIMGDLAETANALTAAKRAAGIPCGRNETKNTLRKSFISYRLVLLHDIARVASEAGNSPAIIKKNYLRFCPMEAKPKHPFAEEANRWFNIWPQSADVIQLSLALK